MTTVMVMTVMMIIGRMRQITTYDDDNGEDQENSDDYVDEPAGDIDTEWHELQDIVNMTEEKFRTFWQDKNFQKAFKKFKTNFAKLRNSNQNTIIRHFHDFGVERRMKHSYLMPVQSTAKAR